MARLGPNVSRQPGVSANSEHQIWKTAMSRIDIAAQVRHLRHNGRLRFYWQRKAVYALARRLDLLFRHEGEDHVHTAAAHCPALIGRSVMLPSSATIAPSS